VCALLLIVLLVCLLVGCAEGGEEQAAAPAPAPARGTGARAYENVAREMREIEADIAALGSVCSCVCLVCACALCVCVVCVPCCASSV
jgi:hypothetical protein